MAEFTISGAVDSKAVPDRTTDDNDPLPMDAALSIDLMIKLIFSGLDRKALLSSRLVSQRWAIFGSKELQKRTSIVFMQGQQGRGSSKDDALQLFCCCGGGGVNLFHSIKDLISIINSSHLNSTIFPISNFSLSFTHLSHPQVQAFFDTHGSVMRTVELTGIVDSCTSMNLKKLMLIQAPNLEHLKMYCFGYDSNSELTEESKTKTRTESGMQNIAMPGPGHRPNNNPFSTLKSYLKILEITHTHGFPKDVYDNIVQQSSSKLRRVHLKCLCCASDKISSCLLAQQVA